MSDEIVPTDSGVQWYQDEIAIRGCHLNLQKIKEIYRELKAVTKKEAERIVAQVTKLDDESDEDFAKRKLFLNDDAFRVTVTIIGFEGKNNYGENESIFDSKDNPLPIKTIYFTNRTAFKRNANQAEPPNRFTFHLDLDKPLLFDPSPLLSDPTPNNSRVEIHAEDITYFRAVQNIVEKRLRASRKWYWFIHERFAYDIGLWFVAMPYALYWVTVYCDYLLPSNGNNASFRIGFFIYGMGLSLIAYRALSGYVKWAYPVNVMEENKDRATGHRVVLGGILLSMFVAGVKSAAGRLVGL